MTDRPLTRARGDTAAAPALGTAPGGLQRRTVRRLLDLSAAVGGVGGGTLLLATNLLAGTALLSVPVLANAALVFGGLMFAREYRRASQEPPAAER